MLFTTKLNLHRHLIESTYKHFFTMHHSPSSASSSFNLQINDCFSSDFTQFTCHDFLFSLNSKFSSLAITREITVRDIHENRR